VCACACARRVLLQLGRSWACNCATLCGAQPQAGVQSRGHAPELWAQCLHHIVRAAAPDKAQEQPTHVLSCTLRTLMCLPIFSAQHKSLGSTPAAPAQAAGPVLPVVQHAQTQGPQSPTWASSNARDSAMGSDRARRAQPWGKVAAASSVACSTAASAGVKDSPACTPTHGHGAAHVDSLWTMLIIPHCSVRQHVQMHARTSVSVIT